MKRLIAFFLFGIFLSLQPVLGIPMKAPTKTADKKQQRQLKRAQKKEAKWEKKIQKLKSKITKKSVANGSSIWDDQTFRFGALVALGGLAIRLFAFLPFLGGIFSLIGTLVLLVGFGIMIWVLIDG